MLGEEHHGRVHVRLVNVLNEVLIARSASFGTYSTTTLLTEVSQWGTLDIAEVRNGDNHIVVGIHILWVELGSHLDDACATLIGILLFDFNEFVLDYFIAHHLACEQCVEVLDKLLQLSILFFQLVDTQACEL